MDAELLLFFFLLNLVFEHVRSDFCNSKIFDLLTDIFKKKQLRRRLLDMHNILFLFACFNFEY